MKHAAKVREAKLMAERQQMDKIVEKMEIKSKQIDEQKGQKLREEEEKQKQRYK